MIIDCHHTLTLSPPPHTELKESIKAMQSTQTKPIWSDNERIRIQANLDTNPLKKDILLKPAFKGGRPCEYMSGHTVNAHMNEVFGFNGWYTEYFKEDSNVISSPVNGSGNYHVSVTVNCKVTLADGSFHEDTGTCDGQQTNLHQAMDTARKGAFTDAMKRACRKFGNYMGLGLYIDGGESAKKSAFSTKGERDEIVAARAQEGRDVMATTDRQQQTIGRTHQSVGSRFSATIKPSPIPRPISGAKRSTPVINPYTSVKKSKLVN